MEEDREKCKQAGMDDIVGKPIDFGILFSTMEKIVPEGIGQPIKENEIPEIPQTKMMQTDLPNLDGIDVKKGIQTWQNPEVYYNALVDFSLKYKDVVDKLSRLMKKNDMDETYRITHALKGLSGNLSLTEVFDVSKNVDIAAKDKRIDEVKDLLPLLKGAMKKATNSISQLKSEFKSENKKTKEEFDPDRVKEIIMKLLNSYEQYNPRAAEPHLQKLSEFFSDEDLAQIKKLLKQFNFDGARKETIKFSTNFNIDLGNEHE